MIFFKLNNNIEVSTNDCNEGRENSRPSLTNILIIIKNRSIIMTNWINQRFYKFPSLARAQKIYLSFTEQAVQLVTIFINIYKYLFIFINIINILKYLCDFMLYKYLYD